VAAANSGAFLGDSTDEAFEKQTFDRTVNEYGTPTICVPAAGITRDQIAVKIDSKEREPLCAAA
jgi:hypothetical protein